MRKLDQERNMTALLSSTLLSYSSSVLSVDGACALFKQDAEASLSVKVERRDWVIGEKG